MLILNKKQTQSYPTKYSHNMCCQYNGFSVINKEVISTGCQELQLWGLEAGYGL